MFGGSARAVAANNPDPSSAAKTLTPTRLSMTARSLSILAPHMQSI
jgi:hypothetical protein